MYQFVMLWMDQWQKMLQASLPQQQGEAVARQISDELLTVRSELAQMQAEADSNREAQENELATLRLALAEAEARRGATEQELAAGAAERGKLAGRIADLEAKLQAAHAEAKAQVAAAVAERDKLSARVAELEAKLQAAHAEAKAKAADATTERGKLAAQQDDLEAKLQAARGDAIAKSREAAELAKEITRLRGESAKQADALAAAESRCRALETAASDASRERDLLTAQVRDLDREAQSARAALSEAQAAAAQAVAQVAQLQGELEQARKAKARKVKAGSAQATTVSAARLTLYIEKPDDWGESLFIHYFDGPVSTTWPGVPMTPLGDGWFVQELVLPSATVVFNDNSGHQSSDMVRDRDGWLDRQGAWHDGAPECAP